LEGLRKHASETPNADFEATGVFRGVLEYRAAGILLMEITGANLTSARDAITAVFAGRLSIREAQEMVRESVVSIIVPSQLDPGCYHFRPFFIPRGMEDRWEKLVEDQLASYAKRWGDGGWRKRLESHVKAVSKAPI